MRADSAAGSIEEDKLVLYLEEVPEINCLDEISEAKALLLKSGDIILTVNGQTLSSKKNAYDIFKKARKEPIMIINLLQDGEAKKLLFDFH